MSSRRRPLHTCGVSFLAIAHSSCSRAQDLGGPLGSIAKRMVRITKLVSPLVLALQYQWLLVLSFIDDRLLTIENIVEKIFPPSKLVFDKVDRLLHLIESFPGQFDDAVNKFPCCNEVTFLDWAVVHAICLLKFMMTILMNLGREGTREKEILIDINCNEGHGGYELADKSDCCSEGNVSSGSETQLDENLNTDQKMKSDTMKGTYKEVLEMGTKPVEDVEECKENEKGTNKEVLEMETKPVEDDGECKEDEKSTYKEVLEKKGTRESMEDEEECKENEKCTYKEVLEKGKRESVENKEDCAKDGKKVEKGIKVEDSEKCKNQSQKTKMESGVEAEGKEEITDQNYKGNGEKENVKDGSCGEEKAEANDGNIENEDDILELFETAWLKKPTKKGKGNSIPRSASYA